MFHVSATDALMRVFIDAIEPSNIHQWIIQRTNRHITCGFHFEKKEETVRCWVL